MYFYLSLSAPDCLSVFEFSLHYPHKISCLVMRIKQMIMHSNVSKMRNKLLPNLFRKKTKDSLGEFSNMSYGVFAAERVSRGTLSV